MRATGVVDSPALLVREAVSSRLPSDPHGDVRIARAIEVGQSINPVAVVVGMLLHASPVGFSHGGRSAPSP